MMQAEKIELQFAEDVRKGLSATPKYLPSKYFYNEEGDRLFQEIMKLDEYYLTRAEFKVFEDNKVAILEEIQHYVQQFQLIEFGAGDGYKTKILLKYFLDRSVEFSYLPIDISQNVLDQLGDNLAELFPELSVEPLNDDYFEALKMVDARESDPKVILFLGSNIGNFTPEATQLFLNRLYDAMSTGDMVLIGFDLKKDPQLILAAYNDRKGVTRDFNLNLLCRINNELGANFNPDLFMHHPVYDPQSGLACSYLLSREAQKVYIKSLDQEFEFEAWESIHTEISRKFSVSEVDTLAYHTGFQTVHHFFDPDRYFLDSLWIKK